MNKQKKERDVMEIIDDYNHLYLEVSKYIHNTNHCIYYWITNKEIQEYIEEYPDDFEDYINVNIAYATGNLVYVSIVFEKEHPHNIESIKRSCDLVGFRQTVEYNYSKYSGSFIDMQIESLERDLDSYEGWVKETRKKLDILKEQKKKSENK